MQADYGPKAALIHGKVMAPGLPSAVVRRPRLDDLFGGLLEAHDVLSVFAVAGSGKTVQAQLFARELGWPLAWLTLDARDQSLSRMLSYLAAALEPIAPDARRIAEDGFANQLFPEDIAALLAESVTVDKALVVIDQCEAVADCRGAEALLANLVEYLPRGVHTILLGRTELQGSVGRVFSQNRMGRVLQEDLALTEEEAAELVVAHGQDASSVAERCLRAGGWMAAVAFGESDRSHGVSGTHDFLDYIAAEIFSVLSDDERRFLLDTAVLDQISPQAATALCGPQAGSICRLIRHRHLPATTMDDGSIVLHSCFRDFLLDQLAMDDPARMAEMQRRYAMILVEVGELERATELLLSVGCLDEAADAAESAVRVLSARGDWGTVLRWLEALGPERVSVKPALLGAQIRSLRSVYRLEEARAVVRELDSAGRLSELFEADPGAIYYAAGVMLWSPKDGLALLDSFEGGARATGMRYMLEVISGEHPVQPPHELLWAENDRIVSWALLLQGRLYDLVGMLNDAEWPPRGPYTTTHPLVGLLCRGETERVRELFDQVSDDVKGRSHLGLWLWCEACLLLAEGDAQAAMRCAERAIMHSRRSGGDAYLPVYQTAQARALLNLGEVDHAIEVLDDALASSRDTGLAVYAEWCMTFLGRAYLVKGRAEDAVQILRAAVAGMSNAARHLFLPVAAVYLSEAEWRTGNEDASDSAAALAYTVSERMGGFAPLRTALSHFPAVLHRQLDLDVRAEDWRHLAVPSAITPVPLQIRSIEGRTVKTADIQPFGPEPDVIIDGRPARVGRFKKAMELVCYVGLHPGGVRRDDVQARVFPDSDQRHGSNYFRQVTHQLRKATGLTFQRSDSFIDWSADVVVDSYDARFERMVIEARAVGGEERLKRLRKALDLVTGPYLPTSELEWVADRSFRLEVLQEDAELELAELAIGLADFPTAASFAEKILAKNPSNPAAYKMLLEVEISSGTRSGALAVYQRAREALDGTGLSLGPDVTARLSRHLA